MIIKVKGGYKVKGESGRSFGTYASKAAARKRLAQIEWFKAHPK